MAAAMMAIALVALVTRIDVQDVDVHRFHRDTWWSWAATLSICATLAGRRRWPLRCLAVALLLMLPLELARHRDSVAFFALLIAVYSVAGYLPIRLAWRGIAMTVALHVALYARGTTIIGAARFVSPSFFVTAFVLGRLLHLGRARQDRAVEAAVERAAIAAETSHLKAADERLRMAHELHDVVAHSLSVIAVQAGIGVHLIDRKPTEAALALDAIRTTSRTTASELTRLVDVLRDGDSSHDDSAPTLLGIDALIEHIRSAGLTTAFTGSGDVSTVPMGVSSAAYRIVQEALTNVVRHAGRAVVSVTIHTRPEQVELCVEDNGRGLTPSIDAESVGGGHGLIGMQERAQMYGGSVRSGPRPGGGFRVQATLPFFSHSIPDNTPATAAVGPNEVQGLHEHRRNVPAWMWDAALALFMAVLVTVEVLVNNSSNSVGGFAPTHRWAWLPRIGCCLALVARRRYPSSSFVVIWVLSVVLATGGHKIGLIVFVMVIGLCTVVTYSTKPRAIAATIALYAAMAIMVRSKPPQVTATGATWISILFTAAAIAAYIIRRDRESRLRNLAEREDAADAQSRRTRLVMATERLRIADELSTIITRSIQTITEQAGTGSQMVEIDPVAARKALQEISAISRDSLNDVRRLLKRIRTENDPAYTPIVSPLSAPHGVGEISAERNASTMSVVSTGGVR
jgi:signal transduction histidine kinase